MWERRKKEGTEGGRKEGRKEGRGLAFMRKENQILTESWSP